MTSWASKQALDGPAWPTVAFVGGHVRRFAGKLRTFAGLQEKVEISVCRSVLVTGGVLSVIPLLALSRASPFRG